MNSYIFLTTEGYTFQPNSESSLPDIENLQVIGFAAGDGEREAFENLIRENPYLLKTGFNEVLCIEVRGGTEDAVRFHISEKRQKRAGERRERSRIHENADGY